MFISKDFLSKFFPVSVSQIELQVLIVLCSSPEFISIINDSFNRGTNLSDRWKPRATLDVSGDMRLTSKIDDIDSTYKYTRYYKNDPRILDGADPKELIMNTDTYGYQYIGDFVIQREVPSIVEDPLTDPAPIDNFKLHDYWRLDTGLDDKYFDKG